MNQVIATLPLSPRQNADIGYYLIPLIANIIASFAGISTVNAVNILGAKETTTQDVDTHFNMLKCLGIASQFQWCDGNEAWNIVLTNLFHKGLAQGWILQDERTIMVCPCGKTEFIVAASTLSKIHGTRKTYEIQDDKVFCLLCQGFATPRTIPCLLIRMPEQVPSITIIPTYAAAEWNRLAADNRKREILVSRVRETGIQAECVGRKYNIDVDFVWKLLLERLSEKNIKCLGLVVGHKSIKHALSITMLSSLIGVPIPQFVISTPYISFDFGCQLPINARELVNLHDAEPLRWLLSMAIGCHQKEFTLQSKLIYLIKHSIGTTLNAKNYDLEQVSADILWRYFNTKRIQKMLLFLRQNKPELLDPRERHLASLLGLLKKNIVY
ncbi:MAG: hypothetical protein A2998_02525 [Candidatus Staskawiczbacteria bacterium RIFCSPLOWO2_01_FULL_37_25b]|uniref:Uncharacterized protein n=1 Tax=Candidatus Staskawiczbacteria bacterium RIFCSPLOWO2_01_FULL_37_25b TaxID=1802213 RepID=A0A1G2IE44_9BACT|nr:MAG: hypothetical protein A2998_02525 [Candidatus Staskawiczbacteria bacterium RIFCSPLOWO2_01_FULL_37_25b]